MSDIQPVEKSSETLKNEALEKKRAQLAIARGIAAEKRKALGNLTKTKKQNKEKEYQLLVEEEKEREKALLERMKDLERRRQDKKKPKKVFTIEKELTQEPLESSGDEATPPPPPVVEKKVKKPVPKPPPPSESDSDSSEDEAVLRKRARKEIRAERNSLLAERYRKNVEDLKLQELKSIMRGGHW